MLLMTIPAYAAAHGVSRQAALKWKDRGALAMVGGKVNVAASDHRMRELGLGRYRGVRPDIEGLADALGAALSSIATGIASDLGVPTHSAQILATLIRLAKRRLHCAAGAAVGGQADA